MAINDWWAGDATERYWMEITDRTDLGEDLNAPTLNGAGREEWGYTLVTETRPEDIVLHWHANLLGRPALVGWSLVTGPLAVEDNYTWMAHGTRGRMRGTPTTGPGWRMPCSGLERLAHPIDKRRLAELESQLKDVHGQMTARVKGALYFPFVFYRAGEVRAAQTYLTKFPAALISLFPELAELPAQEKTGQRVDTEQTVSDSPVRNGLRRLQDSELKHAIEQHAVRMVKQYYLDRGAVRVDELGKPYDLRVTGLGPERHVEVKGSSVAASAVELTVNEVAHAHNHKPTDLAIVDEISVHRLAGGGYATSGGNFHVWSDWEPEEHQLAPTRFRYTLPARND